MEQEYNYKRYSIPKKDYVTIGVSRKTRSVIRLYAMNRNLSITEAAYLLIKAGLYVVMAREELKRQQFLVLISKLLSKLRSKKAKL